MSSMNSYLIDEHRPRIAYCDWGSWRKSHSASSHRVQHPVVSKIVWSVRLVCRVERPICPAISLFSSPSATSAIMSRSFAVRVRVR